MILRGRRADAVPFFCPHPAALRHWGTRTEPAAHPAQSPSGVRREAKRPPRAHAVPRAVFHAGRRTAAPPCAGPAPACPVTARVFLRPALLPLRRWTARRQFPRAACRCACPCPAPCVLWLLSLPLGPRRSVSPRMDGRPVSSCSGRSMGNVSRSTPAWTFSVIRFTVINAQIN